MLASSNESPIRAVTPLSMDQRTEDRLEVESLLRFVGRPMVCGEIAKANDIPISRAKRAIEDLLARGAVLPAASPDGRLAYSIAR